MTPCKVTVQARSQVLSKKRKELCPVSHESKRMLWLEGHGPGAAPTALHRVSFAVRDCKKTHTAGGTDRCGRGSDPRPGKMQCCRSPECFKAVRLFRDSHSDL